MGRKSRAKSERRAEKEAAREPKFCPACQARLQRSDFPKGWPADLQYDFTCLGCGQKWHIWKDWPPGGEILINPPELKKYLDEFKQAGWTLTEADRGEYDEAVLTHVDGMKLTGQGRNPYEAKEKVVREGINFRLKDK